MNRWFGPNTYYSFILDPFILIGFAILIRRKFGRNKWILMSSAAVLLSLVLLGAIALYFDLIDVPGLGEAGQGNHFMWKSGFDKLFGVDICPFINTATPTYTDFLSPLNILALFIFVFLYPLFLSVGIYLGHILFGQNEK